MAHFLEHLVFKGGESYPTYKDVNETAERLGGVLNAYTSHDLVAFHITVRAESAPQAIDLLTDFVGRPRLDAEELDRERGVVIQEINRAYDQPSTVAEYLIDRAAFGEHPLGRTVLGPEENLRSFTREGIVAFRERRWAGARGGAFLAGNLEHLPPEDELHERFARFPGCPSPSRTSRRRLRAAEARRGARHQPVAPAHDLPARASPSPTCANAPRCRSTRRCSAARWARGCSRRSARSAGCATRSTRSTTRSPTSRSCSSARGWSRASASRRTRACARSSTSCASRGRPRRRSSGRAPTRPAGSCSRSRTPTRSPATRANQSDRLRRDIDPDAAIAALDAVTFDEVREVAAGVADKLAVAVRGPAQPPRSSEPRPRRPGEHARLPRRRHQPGSRDFTAARPRSIALHPLRKARTLDGDHRRTAPG